MRLEDLSLVMPDGEVPKLPGAKQAPGDFAGLMQALLAALGVPPGYENGTAIPVLPDEVLQQPSGSAESVGGKPYRGGGEYAGPAGGWPSIIPECAGANPLHNMPAGAGLLAAGPLLLIPGGDPAGISALPDSVPGAAEIAAGVVREGRRENMPFGLPPDAVEPSAVAVQAGIQAPEQFPGEPLAAWGKPLERPLAIQQTFGPAQDAISQLPAGALPADNRSLPAARSMLEPPKPASSMSGSGETLWANLPPVDPKPAAVRTVPVMPAGPGMLKPEQPAYTGVPNGWEPTGTVTVREAVIQPVDSAVSDGWATRTEQSFSELPGYTDTGAVDEQVGLYRSAGPPRLETAHHGLPRSVRPVGMHELIPLLQSQLPVWVVRAAAGRGFTTQLKLHPAGLGELQVEVQLSGQQASVHFVTASAEVKDVLQAALPQLREALQQHNLQLTGTSVTLADGQHGLAQQFSGHYGAGSGRRQSGTPAVPPGREEHSEEEKPRTLPGGLNRLV